LHRCGQTLSRGLGIWVRCCKSIEFIVSTILDQSSTYSEIIGKETLSNETKIQRKGRQMHIPKMALENPHLEPPVLLPSSKNYFKRMASSAAGDKIGRWFLAVGERLKDQWQHPTTLLEFD